MVLPILISVIAAPGLLGTQEAIRQSQAKEKREEHRARRCNLIATCVKSSLRSREINGRPIVLKNGKLYIDTGTSDGAPFGHPYAGYYLPYPDVSYEGLVTTITDEAPIMNWVYVDKDTYELKYGVRANAQPNFTGPFDCTRQDRRLTFDGWEGWCAVEEIPTLWALYFDKDDDGLRSKVAPGTRVLEIELTRKEKRWKKEVDARQEDQTTKREIDAKEDAPVDNPVTVQPQLNPPGITDNTTDSLSATDAAPAAEPLRIPRSIFPDDPPLPLPKSIFSDGQPLQPQTSTSQPQQQSQNNSTPPTSFESSQPTTETTPSSNKPGRLNRSSGSKALAQAQMFEAMNQKSNDTPFRNGRPVSRHTSGTSTASNSPERIRADFRPAYLEQPESTTLAADPVKRFAREEQQSKPRSQSPSPFADPAVFGAFTSTVPSDSSEKQKPKPNSSANRRSFGTYPSGEPPKLPLPAVPTSPKDRGGGSTGKTSPRTSAAPARRRPASPEGTKPFLPQTRRPSVSRPARALPKIPRDEPGRRPPMPVRQRNGSTSSQNDPQSQGSPQPRVRTDTAVGRKSMAATMSTGGGGSIRRPVRPNAGSPSSPADAQAYGSRTSNLYRELDNILKPSRSTANGSVSNKYSQNNRQDDRRPPLRRAATSRVESENPEYDRRPPQRSLTNARMGPARRKDRDADNSK
ncbi:hypothetical protein CC78DRAFT_583080 [Lojkania enalia]|uniref:Uncharacterized protein n=1 Tax=Lojkania enalia TaxID=147567 RepID=A0A9P4K6Q1_9PLEO|nr:hypothetical protein CC78DRAFT_583080 [Didymosphaeria enalia]